ncbi:MAG: NADH-quinone oxidoreductase subunit J [Elusimicrobia bacterium]|jgi:NADH-quinone oxidoreductase subunit J|nr:NADH-quinone oxidoreductase subunit J [Elusimicrobiota bacterium]
MTYHNLLFVLAAFFAVWAVMARKLLTSAIMLALVSVTVSLIFFDFGAPWAGVFELSVCAGLITVLFIGGVSLIRTEEEKRPEGRARFYALPLALAAFAIAAWFYLPPFFEELAGAKVLVSGGGTIGAALWGLRRPDLLGQVLMLAAGVFVIKSVFPRRTEK